MIDYGPVYPVITLYQPWATWIMRGWKTIETRTHNRFACLKNRTILIHAGMTIDNSDFVIRNPYLSTSKICENPEEVTSGFILGMADVVDFSVLDAGHSKAALIDCSYGPRYGLFLKNVNKFGFQLPCKGEMGIWYYDLDKMQKVKKPEQPTLFNQK